MAFFASVRANKNALAGGASVVGAGVGLVRVLFTVCVTNACSVSSAYSGLSITGEFYGCGGNAPRVQRVDCWPMWAASYVRIIRRAGS